MSSHWSVVNQTIRISLNAKWKWPGVVNRQQLPSVTMENPSSFLVNTCKIGWFSIAIVVCRRGNEYIWWKPLSDIVVRWIVTYVVMWCLNHHSWWVEQTPKLKKKHMHTPKWESFPSIPFFWDHLLDSPQGCFAKCMDRKTSQLTNPEIIQEGYTYIYCIICQPTACFFFRFHEIWKKTSPNTNPPNKWRIRPSFVNMFHLTPSTPWFPSWGFLKDD